MAISATGMRHGLCGGKPDFADNIKILACADHKDLPPKHFTSILYGFHRHNRLQVTCVSHFSRSLFSLRELSRTLLLCISAPSDWVQLAACLLCRILSYTPNDERPPCQKSVRENSIHRQLIFHVSLCDDSLKQKTSKN